MVSHLLPVSRCVRPSGVSQNFWSAQDEMDRWFNRFVDSLVPASVGPTGTNAASVWEDGEGLHLALDLPGVKAEDLEITSCQGKLQLRAERKAPEGERTYLVNQHRYGQVERVLTLPEAYDAEAVQAELRDGVLHLRLAKRPEAQPRKIEIRTG